MEYLLLTWHLVPTLAVIVLALFVVRAVSVRVVWRGSDSRRFDDEPA
jgi:NhaP-type Na+/H+ or K+/H+ antiporter